MTTSSSRRRTAWTPAPVRVRDVIGGTFLLAGVTLAVVMLGLSTLDSWSRLPLSIGAGALIGLGYQIAPALHRNSEREPDRLWYLSALWVCLAALALAVVAAALQWQGWWTAMLTVSTAALAIFLTERFPAGGKWPSAFLMSAAFDALMLFQLSTGGTPQFAVVAVLFLPALVVAVTLTVWAYMVRTLNAADYAKATEVARGVLCAWLILIASSLAWSWSGMKLGTASSLDPLRFAIPLVTFGSLIATVTTGWTRFREARALLRTVSIEAMATD